MSERCVLCGSGNHEILRAAKQEVYVTGDRKNFDIGDKKIEKVI